VTTRHGLQLIAADGIAYLRAQATRNSRPTRVGAGRPGIGAVSRWMPTAVSVSSGTPMPSVAAGRTACLIGGQLASPRLEAAQESASRAACLRWRYLRSMRQTRYRMINRQGSTVT
jgi:hypothetical protein